MCGINKNNEFVYIDLFSGIGGFSKGFEDAKVPIKHHYFSEIDDHCIAVYKYKFKKAQYVGSVEDVRGTELRKQHPNGRFIVTFGFPCQDLSIAGRGAGLQGERSGLFYEAIRVIKEVEPEVFIFENVKGLLSSNDGKDFETVLRTIADIGLYVGEWQLVNTAWILPQNRERIYFVGHFRGRSEPRVFPFRENDFKIEKLQGIGHTTNSITTRTQNGGDPGSYIIESKRDAQEIKVNALKSRDYKGATNFIAEDKPEVTNFQGNKISNALRSGGSSTFTNKHNWDTVRINPAPKPEQEVRALFEARTEEAKELRKASMKQGKDWSPRRGKEIKARDDHNANTITATQTVEQLIKIGNIYPSGGENGNVYHTEGLSPAIKSGETNTKGNNGIGSSNSPKILEDSIIRRLTEIECERLQGFPDNWTKYGDYKGQIKEVSRTQRYKQLGNAVTVDWPRMIARRLFINQLKT